MQHYRLERLQELMKPPEVPVDRSEVLDLDLTDMHDFKFISGSQVELMESRLAGKADAATVLQVLDEMI